MQRIYVHAFLALLFAASSAHADSFPRVAYSVALEPAAWQPVDASDLAKLIEHAALEVLSRAALMQLERVDSAKIAETKGDFAISIQGRTIDEAQTHTVYLAFSPGKRSDLPNFVAAETTELKKLPRPQIVTQIEAAARKAATRLIESLRPELERYGKKGERAPLEITTKLPFAWAPVKVPRIALGRATSDLMSPKEETSRPALRELAVLARSQASARHMLEHCAIVHAVIDVRIDCLRALRPLSRDLVGTQKVVIMAFASDQPESVRKEASDQMMYFRGASRLEAIQAWLFAVAHGTIEDYVLTPLIRAGDLPNLEMALRDCLVYAKRDREPDGKQRACMGLVGPLHPTRRRAVFWPFLRELDPGSVRYLEDRAWEEAIKLVLEEAEGWDPHLETFIWQRFERTLSKEALGFLADWAEPSRRGLERLIEAYKTTKERAALAGIERMGKHPEQRKVAVDLVTKLLQASTGSPEDLRGLADSLGVKK